MLNLELYKVFYTVAKCGSLTKASRELYISQPAVSQSIKQLEDRLGVKLFNRNHRGMELSSAGAKLLYKNVADALKLIENAENGITELNNTATGNIRIGATDSIFSHLLADKIVEFNQKYPAVGLELISSTSPRTIEKLKSGNIDIAFVNLPVEDEEVKFIDTVSLLSDVFVAGKKYKDLKDKTIPLKSLREYPVLLIEENTVARKSMREFLKSHGIELNPDIEVANWDFMIKLVAKGMGIGCIPREYCTKELARGELFEVNVSPALPVRGVGIALPAEGQIPFALRQFIKLFGGTAK
ncbi:MAG: LysR family transcriptional regulator [Clostridia bacterium]|nr:LysR family transcriptional regulator [Clostridia bacterium]